MLLFLYCKLKCFINIVAKFFTNLWINIVKKKYNFFKFVYEFGVLGFYVLKKVLS